MNLEPDLFNCPNCGAQYKVIRVEADSATTYGRIECRHCGSLLDSGEGGFILKYFLVGNPRKKLKPPAVE